MAEYVSKRLKDFAVKGFMITTLATGAMEIGCSPVMPVIIGNNVDKPITINVEQKTPPAIGGEYVGGYAIAPGIVAPAPGIIVNGYVPPSVSYDPCYSSGWGCYRGPVIFDAGPIFRRPPVIHRQDRWIRQHR